jgi:hypothetical protein
VERLLRRSGGSLGAMDLSDAPEMIWIRETEDGVGSAKSGFCRCGEASTNFKSLRRIGLRLARFECIGEQCGPGLQVRMSV